MSLCVFKCLKCVLKQYFAWCHFTIKPQWPFCALNRCILKRTTLGNFRGETPLFPTLLCIQVLAVRSFFNPVHAAHWNVLSVSWIEFQCYDLQYLDGILFKATCDWSTLSWLFCFVLTIMSIGMCFTSLALGTPHRCLYDSSNHNTKYMSALEMLSKTKGENGLWCAWLVWSSVHILEVTATL